MELFACRYKMTHEQAKMMRSTGEHLKPHAEGGSGKSHNIVTACQFCNSKRHQRLTNFTPNEFKRHVASRLNKGKWNDALFA